MSEEYTVEQIRDYASRWFPEHRMADTGYVSIGEERLALMTLHACRQIDALTARLAAANADIDRLNQMLRATGYGQGQIDAYADECEARERAEERLAAAEALWEAAVQFEGSDWADHIAQSVEAAKGGRDE